MSGVSLAIEHSFLQWVIRCNRWVCRSPEFEHAFRSLSQPARAVLAEVSSLVGVEIEKDVGVALPRAFLEWLCFTVAALNESTPPTQWEHASPVEILPRLLIEIRNADAAPALVVYREASTLLQRAFARIADQLGVSPPDRNDAPAISRFLAKVVERPVGATAAMYRSLSQDDVDALSRLVLSIDVPLGQNRDTVPGDFLARLAVTGTNRLTHLYRELYDSGKKWPGVVYIHPDEAFRNWLAKDYMDRIYRCESPDAAPLLWMCDDYIGGLIAEGDLAIVPELPYEALQCGYTIGVDGSVSLLHPAEGYEMVPFISDSTRSPALAFAVAEPVQPFSRYLLDIDLTDPSMAFLGLDGARLRIPYVPHYDPVFWRVDMDGGCAPWDADVVAEEDMESDWTDSPEALYRLGPKMATAYESAPDASLVTTHLGGLPAWEQDPGYPQCPECGERMTFLLKASANGFTTAYACLCHDCEIAGVVCQCD